MEKNIVNSKMADIYPPLSFITLNVSRLNSQTAEIGIWLYERKKETSNFVIILDSKKK